MTRVVLSAPLRSLNSLIHTRVRAPEKYKKNHTPTLKNIYEKKMRKQPGKNPEKDRKKNFQRRGAVLAQ